jgi:hypothetical protein
VASAAGGRLIVESATLDLADGQLLIEARFSGLKLDPTRRVGLDVGGSVRWMRLEPSGGGGQRFATDSDASGCSFSLDLERGRFIATDDSVRLARRKNPVIVTLQQGNSAACVKLEFTEAGDRWTFNELRNRQLPCE